MLFVAEGFTLRLGQGDLGDSPDRVSLPWHIRVPDHSGKGHGGTKQPANPTGARRAAAGGRFQHCRRDREA